MFLKKAHIVLPLRLIVLGVLSVLFFTLGSSLFPLEAAVKTYDIVIVGGGSGGTSAAIQAARMGSRVAIIEQTDWLGGQMGAAGVSNMDEGGNERTSGLYAEFVQKVAARYGGEQNIHKCYFGGGGICIEPKIAKDVLSQMASETGRIDVFYRTKATSVLKSGNTVTGITTLSTATGGTDTFNAKVIIDATEYGDLLPKAGIAYRVGNTTSVGVNQNACIQDITYTAIAKKYDYGIPGHLKITTPPPGYDSTVESRFAEMVSNTSQKAYTDGSGPPFNWKWVRHTAYRGMPDSSRAQNNNTAASEAGANTITKTGINFANDYPSERPYFSGQTTLTARYIEDEAYRTQVNCSAKLKTIQFLYYMQKQNQNWSVADDQGYDTAFNTTENSCANIPSSLKEIEKRLPQSPYVREGRRMIGITTYTSGQLRSQKKVNRTDGTAVKAVSFSSSIAVGGYDDDLHNCSDASTLEAGLDSIGDKGMGYSPFQVPFETLIPQSIDGFVAAEKNISQSRLVNGATRLQPITMLTGQAAGAIASLSVQGNKQPRSVKPIDVQIVLATAKSTLALAQFNDVPSSNTYFVGANISSLYNIFLGDGSGNFNPNGALTRGTGAILLTRLFNYPTNGTEDDAITQIRARGLSSANSNSAYNPSGELYRGDLAVMLARGLGNAPASVDAAISYLAGYSISVECGGGACVGYGATRGIFANAAAYTLKKLQTSTSVIPGEIPEPTATPTPVPVRNDPVGSHDALDNTHTWGWVCDVDAGNHVTDVHFYSDGVMIGATTANLPGEASIGGYCGGTTNHRFDFGIPASVRDGRAHTITAYAIDVNGQNNRALWNSPKTFTFSGGTTVNTPASNLQANVQANGVALTWVSSKGSYMNTNAADGDHIQVYTNSNYTGTRVLDGGVGGGTTSWNIPVNTSGAYNTVRPGTTYYARIYSFNAPCGCSTGTAISFTTQAAVTNDKPVTNLQANVQANGVALTWVSSTGRYMNTNASDGDHIQVYTNSNFTGTRVLDGGVGGGTTSWNIPVNTSGAYNTLRPGTTYYARVYSFNAPCGCSDGSTISFTTQAAPVTSQPVYSVSQANYGADANAQKIKGSFDGLTSDGKFVGWVCDSDNYGAQIDVHIYVNGSAGTGQFATAVKANLAGESGIGGFCGGTTAHRYSVDMPAQFKDGVSRRYYVHGINVNPGPNSLLPWGNGRDIAYRP